MSTEQADSSGSNDMPAPRRGYNALSIPEERTMTNLYATLSPSDRTWRCEQMKKSADLMQQSWELLRPIAEGHWDKENNYKGLSCFIKAVYEGQGYASFIPEMALRLSDLIRITQEHMPYVESGGRRVQADDNPARYALRVAFNCLVFLFMTDLTTGPAGERGDVLAGNIEMQERALQMCGSCMDKLGGPQQHEGSLTGEDASRIARLATASGPDVERITATTPIPLMTIYMLQVLYDIDLRKVKWVLMYVASRCAKEAYGRAREAVTADQATSRTAWVSYAQSLSSLEPDSPVGAFMAAEARCFTVGFTGDTLKAMRAAVKLADRRGDDLVSWLGHMNVAYGIMHGVGEGTFEEDEVLQEMDTAAEKRSSVSRWGGTVLLDGRCKALKADILKHLEAARQQRDEQLQQLQQQQQQEEGSEGEKSGGAKGTAAGGSGSGSGSQPPQLPPGRLPCITLSGKRVMKPVGTAARQCGGCKFYFHKAMACGRCRQAWYCSRACQGAHWKAGHKNECATLAAARPEGAGGAADEADD